MATILITGANKGLGYEAARRLLAEGHEVWVAARDRERGSAAAESLGARFVVMDVTDDASVAAARDIVARAGGLDVLVNNAGIVGPRSQVPETTAGDVRITFETDVFGPIRVVHAFTELDASSAPVVVNVSSGAGSLGYANHRHGPAADILLLGFPLVKAALNMLTVKWVRAHPRWRVNAADPGFTATDLNAHRGTQTVSWFGEEQERHAVMPQTCFLASAGVAPAMPRRSRFVQCERGDNAGRALDPSPMEASSARCTPPSRHR